MKKRTTLILLLLVAGMATYVTTWEARHASTKEKLLRQTHPFVFAPGEVEVVELVSKSETVRLVRKDGIWRMSQPLDDRANPDLIKQLLDALLSTEVLETVKRDDLRKSDLKRTGMGDTAIEVTVRGKLEPLAQCRVGANAAIDGTFYLGLAADKVALHLTKSPLAALVSKPSDDWRDPKLVRLKADDIARFAINAGTGGLEFVRSPGQPWSLVKPLETRGSDERISAVLAALLNLQVRPTRTAAPEPVPSGPAPAAMKIAFSGPRMAAPLELTLHPGTDPAAEVQVETSDRQGAFLAKPKVNDFWKLQPNHLRDPHLVRIPAEALTALRIRSSTYAEVVLDKQADNWVLSRFGKQEPANHDRVKRVLDGLNSAQVRDFLSDAAVDLKPFGLQQPFLTIEWRTAGATAALEFGQSTDGTVTARRTDEPFIYRVNSSILGTIPPDSVRWRGTKIVDASIFAVRRIIIAEGDRPSVTLNHDPDDASFTAITGGRDVTAQLDKARANRLLQMLVNFEAADWSSDRSLSLVALRNPSLTVQILLSEPGNPKAAVKPVTLSFAPTQPGMDTALYHGRMDLEPDTFLINRDLYYELVEPLVK